MSDLWRYRPTSASWILTKGPFYAVLTQRSTGTWELSLRIGGTAVYRQHTTETDDIDEAKACAIHQILAFGPKKVERCRSEIDQIQTAMKAIAEGS